MKSDLPGSSLNPSAVDAQSMFYLILSILSEKGCERGKV
jgi:hypothetical protein